MHPVTAPDGRTLAVREGGDPAGLPVLVLHGTPGSGVLYEPHVRDAEHRGLRLISYDRPGFGASSRLEARTVADCAADVLAICDALGIDRFCAVGGSGGGPHVLAVAALAPDRVVAAAALASCAPYDADGLDFFAGMGEQNVDDFKVTIEGGDAHREAMERNRAGLLAATPEGLVELWNTLVGPADREVVTGALAAALLENVRVAIGASGEGWLDDDIAIVTPWGFELDSIRVPVLHWHGEQDRFVPVGHGVWLAGHIPGVESRITPEDGHLTLFERRMSEIHAWLLERARLK